MFNKWQASPIARMAIITAAAALAFMGSICGPKNEAPSVPSITGPSSGVVGVAVTFKAVSADPDGDSVAFQFDWGDGTALAWTDYIANDDTLTTTHTFTDTGTVSIKAKARDKGGKETEWTTRDVLVVDVWSRTFGGVNRDYGTSVLQTSDGGFAVAGITHSYGAGIDDAWLVRTDAMGNKLWDRTYGGASRDNALSVGRTTDGGFILTGSTSSYGAGEYDVWLIRTDATGTRIWDKTLGGSEWDDGCSVVQASDGGFVVVGSTQSFGAGDWDAWLIRTDATGTRIWDRTLGGSEEDYGQSVVQTSDGGFLVAGSTRSRGAGGEDVWLIRYDAAGGLLWERTFGGANNDDAQTVARTSDGGFVVTGGTSSNGAGGDDVWLIRTDSAGNRMWDVTFGGAGLDHGSWVEQTNDGGFIVTGSTASYGAGGEDVWLIRTDAAGNRLWDKTFGGTGDDAGSGVAQTEDGGFIVAGRTSSYGAGDADLWLIRTDNQGNTKP